MLACMVAFFSVIIIVNFTMARFASSSWTGLVVQNSYVASQKFNKELERAEAQRQLGWRTHVEYVDGALSIALMDREGAVLKPDTMRVSSGRPAFERLDQQVELAAGQDGKYVHLFGFADGSWQVQIDARIGEEKYRRDLRLYVRQGAGVVE